MIEGLTLSIPQRIGLLRLTLTLSLIVSVLLSFNLWGGERTFPYTAVFSSATLTAPFDTLLVCLMILLLASSLVLRWHRLILFASLLIASYLVLCDINRLQPWFYTYCSMLLLLVFYNGRVDEPNRFTAYFICLQIILASVYFFCGISQLNSWFINTEFSDVIGPLRQVVSERQFLFFKKLGALVPYLLMFTGIGLIISPIRYLAFTLAILLHASLIILLFPSPSNTNYSLWFSNLAFLCMVIILFSGKTKQRYFSPSYLFQLPGFYAVMVLFVVMPFFNLNGSWPDYLSSNFKSGRNKQVEIKLDKNVYALLPLYQKSFCKVNKGHYSFDYKQWCNNELKVECYPEMPVFNSIYAYLNTLGKDNVKERELAMTMSRNLLLKP